MNPFKDWTPQMVDQFNRRKPVSIDNPQEKPCPASEFGKKFEALANNPPKRKPLLNKTESRFLARLIQENPGVKIGIQSLTIKIAHDCRYTPDFWHMTANGLIFYEVKGPFIREDSIIKLKAAAAMFQEFRFTLAQWKDGKWTTKTIPTI